MALQHVIVCIAVLCVVDVLCQQNSCQTSFVMSFYQCATNRSMDRDNFLWLVKSGQSGIPPLDVQGFTERVCAEKQGLYLCVKTILTRMQQLPEVQCPQVQKDGIVILVREILKTLNKKCEDPCRTTFRQSLERCFLDQNFRTPDLLIFNLTTSRDAIMGSNKPEVDRFCQARSDITRCLKVAALRCNDSRILLRSYGLDLDSLDATYNLLCNSSLVYMDSTECYRSPPPGIIQCRNLLSTNTIILENQFADMNISEVEYRDQLCVQRANQLQCEMTAIAIQNDTLKCNTAIVGLRRQAECSLFPLECSISNQNTISIMCQNADFRLPERQFYRAAGYSAVSSAGLLLMMTSVAIFAVF